MWFRLVVVLAGIALTIGGCNSLVSQLFGTHKLRTFPLEAVAREGFGDADYVELTEAYQTGDVVVGPALHGTDRDIVLYPLLTPAQWQARQAGQTVEPVVIAWQKEGGQPCESCRTTGPLTVRGLVREPNPRKNKSAELSTAGYRIAEKVYYLEAARQPLAWYWNVLMIAGGFGLALGVEARAARKRRS